MLKYTHPQTEQTHQVHAVHCPGHDGALMIDHETGVIVGPPLDERPEWAEGLAMALLHEHYRYYTLRTGPAYQEPDVFAMGDLAWLGVDAEGDEMEVPASDDVRQDRLASMLGIDRETGDIAGVLVEVEHSFDVLRAPEDIGAIAASQAEGFDSAQTPKAAAG